MAIQVGDKLPSIDLHYKTDDGVQTINSDELFGGKRVVLFALPGAFTPTCSAAHLPGYVVQADEFFARGVDSIICLSVNDAHVMRAWGLDQNVDDKILMIADGSAHFTRAIGLGEPGTMTGASSELDALLNRSNLEVDVNLRLAAYDALVAANPRVGAYGNNAGFWFRDVGKDYELSIKYYLKSVEAEPDDQDFLNDTALIYLFHLPDRRDKCLPMFEKVLRLVDEDGNQLKDTSHEGARTFDRSEIEKIQGAEY